MKTGSFHGLAQTMALIAVVLASLVLPITKAMASGPTAMMAMASSAADMPDMAMSEMEASVTDAMPCMHGSKKPPCCPEPCRDMAACVVGCFVVADTAPQVVSAPFTYAAFAYGYDAEQAPIDRSIAPPSRPPIS